MPDEEFTSQLSPLYEKERGVQRRLIAIERTKDDFTQLDMEEQVKRYIAELQSEMAILINANPQTPEDRHQVFLLKEHIVDSIVVEAKVDETKRFIESFAQTLQPVQVDLTLNKPIQIITTMGLNF